MLNTSHTQKITLNTPQSIMLNTFVGWYYEQIND